MRRPIFSALCILRSLSAEYAALSPCYVVKCISTNAIPHAENREATLRPNNVKKPQVIQIWPGMTVVDLSNATKISLADIHETVRRYRINPSLNNLYDIKQLVTHLQLRFTVVGSPSANTLEETLSVYDLIRQKKIPEGKLYKPRPSVITIMGHVDHGKTTLLDALRQSEIVKQEFGGITQHIGAFVVSLDENKTRRSLSTFSKDNLSQMITFLDTPGHAAFKNIRQRGANVTDIVLLIIAADDGVLDQTIESIKYTQNAKVPMIVVVNKIDRVKSLDESVKKIKNVLYTHGIVAEDEGGDTILVKISALKRQGLNDLKDAILSLSEIMQIKAPYDGGIHGSIIEVKNDAHQGKMASILVQKGLLKRGALLLASDMSFCKVRSMVDEYGKKVDVAPPGIPVLVSGWKENKIPMPGDTVFEFSSEKAIKEIISHAKRLQDAERAVLIAAANRSQTEAGKREFMEKMKAHDESLPEWVRKFRARKEHVKTYEDDPSEAFKVRVLIRADVQGSAEVLSDIIKSYPNGTQMVKLILLSQSVGHVLESDVENAAKFSNSIIYAFNVPLSPTIVALAREKGVKLRHFNVIYHLVDDLRREISIMIPEIEVDDEVGRVLVQKEFKISNKQKKTVIAGCRCTKGPILRDDVFYKLIRGDKALVDRLEIDQMKHEKEDVKEIPAYSECGLSFKNLPQEVKFQQQDFLVCYKIKKVPAETSWRPPGF